jgi:hypothetical protein
MTPARRQNSPSHNLPPQRAHGGDLGSEPVWPVALRALLLLADAAHPADPALARLSDEDLALLRASLVRLSGGEPTSAA